MAEETEQIKLVVSNEQGDLSAVQAGPSYLVSAQATALHAQASGASHVPLAIAIHAAEGALHHDQWQLTGWQLAGGLEGQLAAANVAVPYACLFLYETVQLLVKHDWLAAYQRPLTGLLVGGLAWLGLTHLGRAF